MAQGGKPDLAGTGAGGLYSEAMIDTLKVRITCWGREIADKSSDNQEGAKISLATPFVEVVRLSLQLVLIATAVE